MSSRWRSVRIFRNLSITCASLLLLVTCALGLQKWQRDQAVHLLLDAVQTPNGDVEKAIANVKRRNASEEVVPLLIELLEGYRGCPVKQVHTNAKLALVEIGSIAVPALGGMKTDAKLVLTALAKGLSDQNKYVRLNAATAIGRTDASMAKVALPILIDLLKDKDNESALRLNAAFGIGSFGRQAKNAIPALLEALNDDADYIVRVAVLAAIQHVGIPDEDVISALAQVVADKSFGLDRWRAIDALGKFGPKATAAVPALIAALKDEELKAEAAQALKKIDPTAALEVGVE